MANTILKSRSAFRLLLGLLLACSAYSQSVDEYQVKAAFLYNFSKFVEWPARTFKSDTEPVRICVLGQNPFGTSLGSAMSGKTVLGRTLVVVEISNASEATDCQILFIATSERRRLRSIFGELRKLGVLTVGEMDGFAAKGGMVNFKLEDGRVRLEINVEVAGQAQLRISSKVLNLAQIVKCQAPD
jgi:hypothetical protein